MPERYSVAVITGGASGLGRGAAEYFLDKNFKVAILDINEKNGKAFLDSLTQSKRDNTIFIKTNVMKEDQIQAAINQVYETFGQIHILLNSAGYIYSQKIYSAVKGVASTKRLTHNLGVNVVGLFNTSKHAANRMTKQEVVADTQDRGVIINISSVASMDGNIGFAAYSATKGAINGMTLPMARDLGKYKIRVLTVAPGVIKTALNDMMPNRMFERSKHDNAIGRLSDPYEFGKFIHNIAHSSFLNGVIIRYDGGYRAPKV